MWDALSPQTETFEYCERPTCNFKLSQKSTYIRQPFPQVLLLNFNWSTVEISCADLLKVYISFADSISLRDFYKMSPEIEKQKNLLDYDIVSFTVFVGAHYMIFVAQKDH
jgi:hypothetical protein